MPGGESDPGSLSPWDDPEMTAALAASLDIGPLPDAEIIPEVPPPLSQPPSQRMSIDTVEHNL
eukprot:9911572-Heterocapsa_arctica.AAC.1